jgi:hypothetical protein
MFNLSLELLLRRLLVNTTGLALGFDSLLSSFFVLF